MRYVGDGVSRGDIVQRGQKRFQVHEFSLERYVGIHQRIPNILNIQSPKEQKLDMVKELPVA